MEKVDYKSLEKAVGKEGAKLFAYAAQIFLLLGALGVVFILAAYVFSTPMVYVLYGLLLLLCAGLSVAIYSSVKFAGLLSARHKTKVKWYEVLSIEPRKFYRSLDKTMLKYWLRATLAVLVAVFICIAFLEIRYYQLARLSDGTQYYSGAKLDAAKDALVQVKEFLETDDPLPDVELETGWSKLQVVSVEPTSPLCMKFGGNRFTSADPEYYDVTTREVGVFGPGGNTRWSACGILD